MLSESILDLAVFKWKKTIFCCTKQTNNGRGMFWKKGCPALVGGRGFPRLIYFSKIAVFVIAFLRQYWWQVDPPRCASDFLGWLRICNKKKTSASASSSSSSSASAFCNRICICIRICIRICLCICICIWICIWICVCINIYICIWICICLWICVCICVCICFCICFWTYFLICICHYIFDKCFLLSELWCKTNVKLICVIQEPTQMINAKTIVKQIWTQFSSFYLTHLVRSFMASKPKTHRSPAPLDSYPENYLHGDISS